MEQSIKIDKIKRTVKDRKASFDFIGFEKTDDETLVVENFPNNASLTITHGFGFPSTGVPGDRFFGFPQISIYQNIVSPFNRIPDADGISGTWEVVHWVDWGEADTRNWEIVVITYIVNKSGSTQNFVYKDNFRRVIRGD